MIGRDGILIYFTPKILSTKNEDYETSRSLQNYFFQLYANIIFISVIIIKITYIWNCLLILYILEREHCTSSVLINSSLCVEHDARLTGYELCCHCIPM